MEFNFRLILSFAISVGFFIDGAIALFKKGSTGKQRCGGALAMLTGILFIAASIIGVVRLTNSTDLLVLLEWILYIVGFIVFIISLIMRKKAK